MAEDLKGKVEKVLEKLRPRFVADGGDLELVAVDDQEKKVTLKFTGRCAGCPMAQMEFKDGIEREIKTELPEVKEVVTI